MSEQKLGYGRFDAYAVDAKNPNRPGGPGEFIAVTRGEIASLKEALTASEARVTVYLERILQLQERLDAAEDVLDYVNENLVINSAKHYRQRWPKDKDVLEIQVETPIKNNHIMVPVSAFATVAEVARHARELFGLVPGDIVDLQSTEGTHEGEVLPRNANMHDFISTHGYKYMLILTGTGV